MQPAEIMTEVYSDDRCLTGKVDFEQKTNDNSGLKTNSNNYILHLFIKRLNQTVSLVAFKNSSKHFIKLKNKSGTKIRPWNLWQSNSTNIALSCTLAPLTMATNDVNFGRVGRKSPRN